MPSSLRVNVNQQDKPSEGVMGLTIDDPSVLASLPVSHVEPQAAGENGWKYSKEPMAAQHFGAEKVMVHAQTIIVRSPAYGAVKSERTTQKYEKDRHE